MASSDPARPTWRSFLLLLSTFVAGADEPRPKRWRTAKQEAPWRTSELDALVRNESAGKCYAAFMFHIEKCAGVTVRNHFARLEQVENASTTYAQGRVRFSHVCRDSEPRRFDVCPNDRSWFRCNATCSWDNLVDDLSAHPPRSRQAAPGERARVFVEIGAATSGGGFHARDDVLGRVLDGVDRVRAAWEPAGCEVVTFTLLREPLSHLLAVYNYFVSNQQARSPDRLGRTFARFVDQPSTTNLQSQLLLGRNAIRAAGRQGRDWTVTAAESARLRAQLARFDLVAPLSRFDELWFLLADRLGLPGLGYALANGGEDARVRREQLQLMRGRRGGGRAEALPPIVRAVEPALGASLVSGRFAADVALYANASSAWSALTRALDARTRVRMERFAMLMGRRNDELRQLHTANRPL
jgi:hypothetical protein